MPSFAVMYAVRDFWLLSKFSTSCADLSLHEYEASLLLNSFALLTAVAKQFGGV